MLGHSWRVARRMWRECAYYFHPIDPQIAPFIRRPRWLRECWSGFKYSFPRDLRYWWVVERHDYKRVWVVPLKPGATLDEACKAHRWANVQANSQ